MCQFLFIALMPLINKVDPIVSYVPDGDDDRPDHPDIYVSAGDTGRVEAPGDDQPVDTYQDDDGVHLDYKDGDYDNSDITVVPDPDDDGMAEIKDDDPPTDYGDRDDRGDYDEPDDRGGD